MGNLFGKRRPAPPPASSTSSVSSHDMALLELKRQRDRLHRYSLRLNGMIDEETALAKSLLASGNRAKAAVVLRRRRYQQKMREGVESNVLNVEKLANSIEWAQVSARVFAALETGKAALERLNAEVSVERVEQLMDETDEAVAEQRKVEELLGGSTAWTASQDEEVEAEVQRMEAEEAQRTAVITSFTSQDVDDAAIAALPTPPTRPVVPVTQKPAIPTRRKEAAVLVAD